MTPSKHHLAMALLAAAACLTACHDHDEVCSDGSTPNVQQPSEETAETLRNLLYQVTAVDTLPANWTSSSYTEQPTYGEVLDRSNPRVRYVAAASTQEARNFFQTLTAQDDDNLNYVWTHDSIGTVTLNTDSTETCYGRISFNVQQLPDLGEIRFVPESTLGTNGKTWTPFYHFGDVIKIEKTGAADEYWMCIRGEYCNGGSHKEYSYWASLTLANENIGKKVKGGTVLKYPKDLGGNKDDIETLPQLLYIIANPTQAWNEWSEFANDKANSKAYAGYNFLEAPFPKNYFTETDFNDIYKAVREGLENDLSKLIPIVAGHTTPFAFENISNGAPLTLVFHGPSVPWNAITPIKFSNCVNYTGKFYTQQKEFNYTHKVSGLESTDFTSSVNKNPEASPLYEGLVTNLATSQTGKRGTFLVARMKRSDKFGFIKNPKNYGDPFETNGKAKITKVVSVPYETNHNNRIAPSDVVQYGGYNALCLTSNLGSEILFTPGIQVKTAQLSERNAYEALQSVVIALANNNTNVNNFATTIFEQYNGLQKLLEVYGEDYQLSFGMLLKNFDKLNSIATYNRKTLEQLFNYSKTNGNDGEEIYKVSMPCYKEVTKNGQTTRTLEKMTLTCTYSSIQGADFSYNISPTNDAATWSDYKIFLRTESYDKYTYVNSTKFSDTYGRNGVISIFNRMSREVWNGNDKFDQLYR